MSNSIDLDHLIAQLVQRTVQLLECSQEELRQIQWQDGEANTDSGYSQLAQEKFQEVFNQLAGENPGIRLEKCASPDVSFSIRSNSSLLTGKI
ncbi:hypothetical protein [Gloeomargarita lithophora]|uniref:hypothetical protein n=1 Tax=Gloeomargarita lithophora TaxID=1188228 RepID=UPI0008F89548|nr:hypothetical protein [Gloeomargarita lithophora]